MIVNPFTGQVINANLKGCNQYSGKKCSFNYSDEDLIRSGRRAGIDQYGDPDDEMGGAVLAPENTEFVERVYLSDRIKKLARASGGEGPPEHLGSIDDYEYGFKPSKDKGLDISGESWLKARKWRDKDGKIYTYYPSEGVQVITPDISLKPKSLRKALRKIQVSIRRQKRGEV